MKTLTWEGQLSIGITCGGLSCWITSEKDEVHELAYNPILKQKELIWFRTELQNE